MVLTSNSLPGLRAFLASRLQTRSKRSNSMNFRSRPWFTSSTVVSMARADADKVRVPLFHRSPRLLWCPLKSSPANFPTNSRHLLVYRLQLQMLHLSGLPHYHGPTPPVSSRWR